MRPVRTSTTATAPASWPRMASLDRLLEIDVEGEPEIAARDRVEAARLVDESLVSAPV